MDVDVRLSQRNPHPVSPSELWHSPSSNFSTHANILAHSRPDDTLRPQDFLCHSAQCAILSHMTTPILIGVPELAVELGVDQSTVHRRIERGELTPFTTVNKRPFFHAEDVAALVRGERTLPPTARPEPPAVGSQWRSKSTSKIYTVTQVFDDAVFVESTDSREGRSVYLEQFGQFEAVSA